MTIIQRTAYFVLLGLMLSACDDQQSKTKADEKPAEAYNVFQPKAESADVLPYLSIQEQPAKVALPFCENKNCLNLDVQTIDTKDTWLNTWIERNQALVIQDQVGLNQNMSLQQAVNAYVKKSDAWQAEFKANKPYELAMYTRIPYQRNQYVLLQLGIDASQESFKVKERYYFFVADRSTQKGMNVLDAVAPKQQANMDKWVQQAYAKWLKDQVLAVRQAAPKKLYWGQADWFFDQEGIGLHYRSNEIIKDGQQLDIYLSKEQTQQVLKADVYQLMF